MNNLLVAKKTPVGAFKWPFYKYDVLMPEQIKTDLFVWLYLSLFIFKNEEVKQTATSYRDQEKAEVERLIKQRFSSVIDDITLAKIIINAEKDFVIADKKTSTKYLKEESITFVETFEELFSKQVQVQHVFQDALTGDVLPCFSDLGYLYENSNSSAIDIRPQTKRRPSNRQIKNALKTYSGLKSSTEPQPEFFESEEYYDPDAEVDWNPEDNEFERFTESKLESNGLENNGKFNVIFLNNSKVLYKLDVEIYIEDGKFVVETPFDEKTTYYWLNKRFSLAITSGRCADLAEYINELENEFLPKQKETKDYVHRRGVADQLDRLGDVYRMIATIDNDDLRPILIDMDAFFSSKSKAYFNRVGEYLECIITPLIDDPNRLNRPNWDYNVFCGEITRTCQTLKLNYRPLISRNIFDAWLKGWSHFKADIVNILLTNNKLRKCNYIYPEFVQELFDLYDIRNDGSHYKKNLKLNYDIGDLEKLARVTRVLIELY